MDERISVSKMSRRRFFKRSAKKMLFSDWINHIFAFFIVGAVVTGIFQYGSNCMMLVDHLTGNDAFSGLIIVAYILLSALVVIPLMYGLVVYETCAVENERGNITDVFSVFSSLSLIIRSYVLCLYLFFKTILYFLPAIFFLGLLFAEGEETYSLGAYVWHDINFAYLMLETLFFACLAVGAVLSSKHLVGVYLCVIRPDMKIRDAFFTAKICCHGSRAEIARLMISFIPLLWLSFYTAGLLFVLYSLPYMLITFVLQSKYLYEKEVRLKNVQKLLYDTNDEN